MDVYEDAECDGGMEDQRLMDYGTGTWLCMSQKYRCLTIRKLLYKCYFPAVMILSTTCYHATQVKYQTRPQNAQRQ